MSADAVLIEFDGEAADPAALRVALDAAGKAVEAHRIAAFEALSENRTACYLWDADLGAASPAALAEIADFVGAAVGRPVEVTRLKAMKITAGRSSDAAMVNHYVVRTNASAGFDEELQRWYDEEHLAGLASVPGAIIARRFLALDHAPRYYACYDLTSPEVLGSPEWLKVRGTVWSDRVRPQFRDTRRTMFRPAGASAE